MTFAIALLLFGLGALAINLYNQIIKQENLVDEAWSGIDVQLKLRHDLVPNLIALVKKYTQHEQEVLVEVVEKRTTNSKVADNTHAASVSGTDLSKSLKTLFAVVESYPELKADTSFLKLQENLVKIEDQLQYARRYYNGSVRNYNTLIESFPNNLLAKAFSMKSKDFFEIERSIEKNAPKVSL